MPMPKGVKIVNQSPDDGEIMIYGYIADSDWDKMDQSDKTATDFKNELDALVGKKTINVYINSGGGAVFAGMAIYNMLKRCTGKTIGHVDGIAASIASVILQGCQDRICTKNSLIMIHNVACIAYGDAAQLRKTAETLDAVQEAVMACYKDRSALTEDEIKELMNAETWMGGQEAVDFGFADKCEEDKAAYSACLGDDGKAIINGQSVEISRYRAFPTAKIPKKQPKTLISKPVEALGYASFEAKIEINHNSF
jgi:ATP-dependent Clp endopeptidase proteolytic subunit ClpP